MTPVRHGALFRVDLISQQFFSIARTSPMVHVCVRVCVLQLIWSSPRSKTVASDSHLELSPTIDSCIAHILQDLDKGLRAVQAKIGVLRSDLSMHRDAIGLEVDQVKINTYYSWSLLAHRCPRIMSPSQKS